jgi:hypothetical protein
MLRVDANEMSFGIFSGLDVGDDGGSSPGVFCSFSFVSSFDLTFCFGFGVVQYFFEHELG